MDSKITPNNINPSCPSCGVHHTGACQLYKRSSPEDDIVWSDSSYSLQEMTDMFESRLPYLARVDLGDFGETEASTIEIGQVLRVAKHYDQPRVIAVSENGRVLSIPLSLPLKFTPLRPKANNLTTKFTDSVKALSRGKLLSEFTKKLPISVTLCENAYSEEVISKGAFSYDDVRQVTLTKLHKYTYLVCNEVTGGILNIGNTLLMPTFMRMKLRISTDGLKNNSKFTMEQLQQMQDSLTESSFDIDFSEILEPQGIFHYEGTYNKNTQYECLQPTEYVQHMYTQSKHPLMALVSSHGHKIIKKVKKVFANQSSPQCHNEDGEGIYETIELTRERKSKHRNFKPKLPPKPANQVEVFHAEENPYEDHESGPVHPNAVGNKYSHPQAGPSRSVHAELVGKFQRSQSQTSQATNVSKAFDDLTKLSVLEVGDLLDKLNLRKYKLKFIHQQIDGSMLRDLVADENFDFETKFEMDRLEVKKLKKCVNENWLPVM